MIRSFMTEESGAVTVDWVVLSAAIVGLGVSSIAAVSSGTGNLGDQIRASLSGAIVASNDPLQAYQWRAHNADATHWWTNMDLRVDYYSGYDDNGVRSRWTRHLREFNDAVEANNNNNDCHGCKGAGNRLDSLVITHQILEQRGLIDDNDRQAVRDAIATYDQTFGS